MKLPRHEGELSMTHNPHKSCYETAAQYLDHFGNAERADEFLSEEDHAKVLETNDFWELQWYPDTPVGFCRLVGTDIEAMLAHAIATDNA